MIKNFETVKAQLSELAGVINSFKSEAVQLRIIELILGASQQNESSNSIDLGRRGERKTTRRRRLKEQKSDESSAYKKHKASSGTGAVATLAQLAQTSFFDKPRTINDIMEHVKHKLARTFKANEFSGKLGRMVRNNELTRQKNSDNQYEYKKP